MRIGILADIHEDAPKLALALRRFCAEGVERIVLLGDVLYEMGRHMRETVDLLVEARAVGVWGNHELGLCHEPSVGMWEKYGGAVLDFMSTLRPRLEVEGCLFSHGLPHWDPTDPFVYYLAEKPEQPEGVTASLAVCTHSVVFVGHFHRWLASSLEGRIPWDGTTTLRLPRERRHLVVIAAVCQGWCASFDTDTRDLVPYRLTE